MEKESESSKEPVIPDRKEPPEFAQEKSKQSELKTLESEARQLGFEIDQLLKGNQVLREKFTRLRTKLNEFESIIMDHHYPGDIDSTRFDVGLFYRKDSNNLSQYDLLVGKGDGIHITGGYEVINGQERDLVPGLAEALGRRDPVIPTVPASLELSKRLVSSLQSYKELIIQERDRLNTEEARGNLKKL